jgi:hypothetical protein
MLRRLDVALNCIVETEDEIVSASNEDLERFAGAAEARRNLPMNKKNTLLMSPQWTRNFLPWQRRKRAYTLCRSPMRTNAPRSAWLVT